jgi:hypothetical protein
MSPAARVAAVLAAAAVAVPTIAVWEGSKNVGYADRLAGNLPTACFGATKGIVVGKRYTDDQCMTTSRKETGSWKTSPHDRRPRHPDRPSLRHGEGEGMAAQVRQSLLGSPFGLSRC